MPKFARQIKLDDTLTGLFLSSLLNGKYRVPNLNGDQQTLISYISGRFLISGFILNSCDFNLSHKSLTEQLKHQRKLQLLKQMSVKNDLNNIARNLNDKCIKHVVLKGAALNADGIYPSGIRFSRDIDLLVQLDQLGEAYDVLKAVGFRYINPKTQDSTKYHFFGHHFPPMINENNTQVELHWRVTSQIAFKNCPFTENMLSNRRISNTSPYIFCPKIDTTIAHLIHHGLTHHPMNLGPIFLFDLSAIFIFSNKKWLIDEDLHKELGIEKNFELCKKIIERAHQEISFSSKSKLIIDRILKESQWLQLSDESKIFSSSIITTPIKVSDKRNVLLKLLSKVRSIRTFYQVSYYSPTFWLILASDILRILKKVMVRYLLF